MSTDTQRESAISTVVAVALVIVASLVVTGVMFPAAPWGAALFGLVLIGIAWALRHNARPVIPVVYGLFGVALVILGMWVTLAKITS